ncbi:OmpA family protein [Rubellimicrobium roseum]|uniref:OmpA family protein n=1 Tax=Rubellimicrobium roseum TaxID=687525 RepID=A0A5C4NF48_9RHOB|nr:OmpA family protein [Rubellimicrobium roseum]TNC70938.1 OmpA family protein [Rubellimicrobium roseum]
MRRLILGTIPAALLLAGCAPELGGELSNRGFGNATMNNVLIQSGQMSYAVSLSNRFADAVPTTINFAFDSAELDAEARTALAQQAAFIRQFPEVRFAVYGHTDLVGSAAYNEGLGLRRAQAAVSFLVSQGIDRGRLEALVSQGETQPLVATQSPERANRRTVTDVRGFVEDNPDVLNGKYAAIVFREYVLSATTPTGFAASGGGGGEAAGGEGGGEGGAAGG